MAPQIRFCSSLDGTRIAYSIEGRGPPLVWVQHWVHHLELDADSIIWAPWLEFLTRRYTLVRFDWRGCGLSDRNSPQFAFERYLEDLSAVAGAAGSSRFSLFGMAGTGSGIAMAYAAAHPDKVERMVLLAPHTKGRMAGSTEPAVLAEATARLKVIELGWPNDTPAYGEFFTALHIPDASQPQKAAYNDLLRRATTPVNAVGLLKTFWQADMSGIPSSVSRPTLILHSRADSVIQFQEGREVASLIPAARFVPLDSRNHLPLASEPAWSALCGAVELFLDQPCGELTAALIGTLTPREREILQLLAVGLDNREMARQLNLSDKTVRNHVSTVLGKIGADSRARAVALARDAGLGRR